MAKVDHTKSYDYERLIQEEKEHYSEIEVTSDLKEGGAHASDCWTYYWQHVNETISRGSIPDVPDWVRRELGPNGEKIEVLSLGSGYCGHELDFARRIGRPCHVLCTDINEDLFLQAREVAEEENLDMEFQVEDLNFIQIEPRRFHLIFAHAVLHHVINLEHLYGEIEAGLTENGVFHMVEVAGQNRKLIWDENERFANSVLDVLPESVTGGFRLAVEAEDEGMEGIRQEEIMPLLETRFQPVCKHSHGAFIRYVCTNPSMTERLDPRDPLRRRCLDFLIQCDDAAVRNKLLQPLEFWGIYRPR